MTPGLQNTLIGMAVAQLLGGIITIAKQSTRISALSRRVKKLENQDATMNERFVPREVVDERLLRIEQLVTSTNALMRANTMVSDRGLAIRGIEAVAKPLTIAEAIARENQWYDPASAAAVNHNPGLLEFEPWVAEQFAATEGDGAVPTLAYFPNDVLGLAALISILQQPMYRGLTIHSALALWAHPDHLAALEENVCAWTGLTPETVIDEHLS